MTKELAYLMTHENIGRAYNLLQDICKNPLKYLAWQAACELGKINFSDEILKQVKNKLHSSDEYTRECCLEVLVMKKDPEIIDELEGVFQNGASALTEKVESISRLRTTSTLPDKFYQDLDEKVLRYVKREELKNPLDLVDSIPNIIFPKESREHASEIIQKIYNNSKFFDNLTEEDIKELYALFHSDYNNPNHKKYRNYKLWDFGGQGGTPIEPYGQPFVGLSSIPYVMGSLVKKIRNDDKSNPLKFIGETFYHKNIIHPFSDCNGRTNFLFMNLYLLDSNFPYIKMTDDDLPEYYRTLNMKNPTNFVMFLGKLLKRNIS